MTERVGKRENLFRFESFRRIFRWPLHYKSTIVVPIVPLTADEQDTDALRGFLCIDSPSNMIFQHKYDVEILRGVSEGLYRKIDMLLEGNINEGGING